MCELIESSDNFDCKQGFLFDLYFHPNAKESDYEKLKEDIERRNNGNNK